MSKFLVTGGAGFIGNNIVRALVREGHKVTVFDNLLTGQMVNLRDCRKRIKFIKGDIRNLPAVKRAMKGADYCIHLAALPSVPLSVEDPLSSHVMNIDGTLNVFLAARDEKIKRVVYASSSAVYGDTKVLPKHERIIPNPKSPYALQKLNNEQYAKMFYELYGLPAIGLRYFNVYGPFQNPESFYAAAVPKFVVSLLTGKSPVIFGDGGQTRDFTYVENVVVANLMACRAGKRAFGEVFNVGCGERISLNRLAEILKKYITAQKDFRYGPPRAGDVRHSLADVRKARKYLGYKPVISFDEGIKRTVDWYKSSWYCKG